MVTFTHAEDGTAERAWEQAEGWRRVGSLDLSGVARLVVVAAHPDDESLGAGGLIALASARGLPVRLIVATDGEASHPASPTHSASQLATIRRREMAAAAEELGAGIELHLLGLPDGALGAHAEALRALLDGTLAELGGEGTLVVAPWRADAHPDHEAAGAAAHAAARSAGARCIEYPVWMWHWADPSGPEMPWARMARLDLPGPARQAKQAAIRAHRSQVAALSPAPGDETLLGDDFLAHFARPYEVFIEQDEGAEEAAGGASLGADFFDEFYAGGADPWGYESRWYEERKRAVTLAALPRRRFRRGLEIGCSIGVLTEALAERCEALLAVDVSEIPLEQARRRLQGRDDIEFSRRAIPHAWPDGSFDLVVLSEVGYYWDDADLATALDRSIDSLTPDGVLVACHWRHPVAEYPRSGDSVHAALARRTELVRTVRHLEEDFVLDVFARPPGASVARETGLV
ncbi:MAG TPA: bifunctional PIG-L family deacetylase/class I SAM-dependent methyltransferase [Microbacteriaceae bacterium]|nr:bifunctional PIG-L family deacetylase/class I SAM-dependent methyltransferase [Microbacteriaceae bacterium]